MNSCCSRKTPVHPNQFAGRDDFFQDGSQLGTTHPFLQYKAFQKEMLLQRWNVHFSISYFLFIAIRQYCCSIVAAPRGGPLNATPKLQIAGPQYKIKPYTNSRRTKSKPTVGPKLRQNKSLNRYYHTTSIYKGGGTSWSFYSKSTVGDKHPT